MRHLPKLTQLGYNPTLAIFVLTNLANLEPFGVGRVELACLCTSRNLKRLTVLRHWSKTKESSPTLVMYSIMGPNSCCQKVPGWSTHSSLMVSPAFTGATREAFLALRPQMIPAPLGSFHGFVVEISRIGEGFFELLPATGPS
jgi:hypothetical protein